MTRRLQALLVWAALLGCACGSPPPSSSLVLATTTSVANSGMLDSLLPAYEASTGTTVQVHSVGSGRALRMLAAGQADVVISHAPPLEEEALAAHPGWVYRKLLYNDFLIAGPPADPAGVRHVGDAVEAMRRIAATGNVRWISRGDESGTHHREEELWKLCGVRPPAPQVVVTGQGMSATMRIASEVAGYTLVDRGTFELLASRVTLVELLRGDPRLLNTYALLARSAAGEPARFFTWMSEGDGWALLLEVIAEGSLPGFQSWPPGRPRGAPRDQPF